MPSFVISRPSACVRVGALLFLFHIIHLIVFKPLLGLQVVSDIQSDVQDEIFGPVTCFTPFDTDAEAIAMANGTEFGLVAGIFTADLSRAHRTANKLRAGQVFVNEWLAGGISTPFGGVGKSGFGREKGLEALYNYVHTKNIAISLKVCSI